jgi:putative restriction endonuclease
MSVQDFLTRLATIKRAPWQGGKAPHKPVMLLAVADWFEENSPAEALVTVDDTLVRLFKENWELLVPTEAYSATLLTQPFYYLKSEGFWTPVLGNGQPMEPQLKSIKRLYETNAAAQLSEAAFRCYQQPVERELIRTKLLDAYFPDTKQRYLDARGTDPLLTDIEADILMEPAHAPRYERRVKGLREWEGYIRYSKFADNLLYQYDYTCCITNLRIEGAPMMVEACHIKPHAICGINSLDNGLALCPNLHTAFDAGLISLSDDYTVLVREKLVENDSAYGLKALEGRKIRLPKEKRFWPGREWVRWQRDVNSISYCIVE